MSGRVVKDAGCFNRQLSLENEAEVADGLGGYSTEYQAVQSIWANIRPTGSQRRSEGSNLVDETTHRITLRFHAAVKPGSRFVTGTRRFEVIGVHDADETRRYLVCDCRERST